MKTVLLTALLLLTNASGLKAQQKYEVTVRDGNRLKPGATNSEIRAWMKSQIIETEFAAAMQPQTSQSSPQLPPEMMQAIKGWEIRRRTLDQLVQQHPELRAEADALYVQYAGIVPEDLSKRREIASLPSALIQAITRWEVCHRTLTQLQQQHPNLKSEIDSLYVRYDGVITEEVLKQQSGR
jgi:hypothetical protein